MTKFEKVKLALENKTRNTNNFITLTKNVDTRHKGKYVIQNVVTRNINNVSYKTLDEVINEFELII